jgi:hypothetical protein
MLKKYAKPCAYHGTRANKVLCITFDIRQILVLCIIFM